jgi:hypothetical protein
VIAKIFMDIVFDVLETVAWPNENKLSHGSGVRKWQLEKAHSLRSYPSFFRLLLLFRC